MNIYIIVSIFLFVLFLIEQGYKEEKSKDSLFYIGSFVVISLLAFRGTNVGGDTQNYCGYFMGKGGMYGTYENNDIFEIGFRIICSWLIFISRTDFCFLFFTSLITMIPFIYLIKRDCSQSKILPLCIYFFTWGMLSITQTAIRQTCAVSFIMIAYIIFTSPINKKSLKYALSISVLFCAIFTHTSCLLSSPMLLCTLFLVKLTKKIALSVVVGSLIFTLVASNFFQMAFDMLNYLLLDVEMAGRILNYYDNEQYALTGEISFNRLGPATLLVSIYIMMSKEKDLCNDYLKMLVVGSSLYNIGASFPMIPRSVFPLLFMGSIFVPSGLREKRNIILYQILLLLLLFFIRNIILYIIPTGDSHMLPYNFIWE